jgi:hypothetical protein
MFPYLTSQSPVERRVHFNKFILFIVLLGISSIVFNACAPTQATTQPSDKRLFRSEDYVVYFLQDSETPAELAEKFLGTKNKSWMIEEANPGVRFGRGSAIVIPLKDRNRGGISSDGFQTIPILTYHRFAEDCNSPLCMPAKTFDLQLRYLKENGYHVITAEELLSFLTYRQGLPQKSVLITMDDGYRSVYDIA